MVDEGSSNFEARSRKVHAAALRASGFGDDPGSPSGPFHQRRARQSVYQELLENQAMSANSPTRTVSNTDRFMAVVKAAQRAQLILPAAGTKSGAVQKMAAERAVKHKSPRAELVAPPRPSWW